MTHDNTDDQLAFLVRDSVADVEPSERLGELRARTTTRRRWWPVAGGSAIAVAAAVTAIGVLGNEPAPTADPGPATSPSPSPAPSPSASPSSVTPTGNGQQAVPAYFVGDTPAGPRLYREFQRTSSPTLSGLWVLESGPWDPDYRSLWPAGSFDSISDPEAGGVHVFLTDQAPTDLSPLAEQQVVYTLSAAFQEPLWVVFHRGETQTEPVVAAPQLDVLSRVNLSDPFEGQLVDDTLVVAGRANSYEANVLWTIEAVDEAAGMGSAFTAEGSMGERLFPFSGEIDVSSLDPGTYTLIVETDDPSGGAEGGIGVFSDTRTFVID